MSFSDLGLSAEVLRAIQEVGYEHPTPIQEQAIPYVLMGRDVLGCAQTGTGKTAGFTLPMIDILAAGRARARMPRSLILEPTRELAAQVAESFEKYGKYHKLTHALLIGGVVYTEQERLLDRGVDVLIATPGRLLDHFERGRILLNDVKVLVIDEADRMLDMGFIPDVERIVGLLPPLRQTLFFSATMPTEIRRLADAFLRNPKEISTSPPASPAATVEQNLVMVRTADKRETLRRLIRAESVRNALIFCNRKRDVDILARSLKRHGFNAGALHGDMDQTSRTATLDAFRRGEVTLLVASDVAARGLDIDDLSHVFNFDVPIHAEDYIHRIGRTGRAGRSGRALTLATSDDGKFTAAIEKLVGRSIPRLTPAGEPAEAMPAEAQAAAPAAEPRGDRRREPPRRREGRGQKRSAAPAAAAEARPRPAPRPESRPEPRPEARAEARAEARVEPIRSDWRTERRDDRRSHRPQPNRNEPEPVVLGMGDHVPAFLMRGRKTGT